jgi:hypothetical protein
LELALNGSISSSQVQTLVPNKPKALPEPLVCEGWICNRPSSCASTYVPRARLSFGLSNMIIPNQFSSDDGGGGGLQVSLREPEKIDIFKKNAAVLKSSGGNDDGDFTVSDSSHWRHVIFSKTLSAVRQAITQNRGYLDRKYVLQSPKFGGINVTQNSRRLTLVLPRMQRTNIEETSSSGKDGKEDGFIALCFPWTARGPEDWVPLTTAQSMRVWLNGQEILSESFPSVASTKPLSEGPCVCVFKKGVSQVREEVETEEEGQGGGGGGVEKSKSKSTKLSPLSSSSPYTISIEPALKDRFITLSHVVWR